MATPAPMVSLDCDLAVQATRAWLAGRALPCERGAWSAHLRACTECEADMRGRAQLAAVSSMPAPAPASSGWTWWPSLPNSKRRLLSFLLVCAALLWLLHRVSHGTRVVDVLGTALAYDAHGGVSRQAEWAEGAPLEAGTIVVLEDGSRLRLRCAELELWVLGPARVRAHDQRVDLLAGLALVQGSGTLGTSRGALHLGPATELIARESRSGLWLACADGQASLRGAVQAELESGQELHSDR